MVAGISSIGVKFSYGVETTAGTKPETFNVLHRINSIGEINLSADQLDATCLEDNIKKYVQGILDTGGNVDIGVNLTNDTITEWTSVISAQSALTGGKQMWFQVSSDYLTKSFFFIGQPPKAIGMPSMDGADVVKATMSITVADFKGLDTKVAPTDSEED